MWTLPAGEQLGSSAASHTGTARALRNRLCQAGLFSLPLTEPLPSGLGCFHYNCVPNTLCPLTPVYTIIAVFRVLLKMCRLAVLLCRLNDLRKREESLLSVCVKSFLSFFSPFFFTHTHLSLIHISEPTRPP